MKFNNGHEVRPVMSLHLLEMSTTDVDLFNWCMSTFPVQGDGKILITAMDILTWNIQSLYLTNSESCKIDSIFEYYKQSLGINAILLRYLP